MKRKKPSFNEEYHGYRTFSELLEDAQDNGLLEVEKHKTSGTYVVTRFGAELKNAPSVPSPSSESTKLRTENLRNRKHRPVPVPTPKSGPSRPLTSPPEVVAPVEELVEAVEDRHAEDDEFGVGIE